MNRNALIVGAIVAFIAGMCSQAQAAGPSSPRSRATVDDNAKLRCDHIPSTDITAVPAPLDRYMNLVCGEVGQGLAPVDGFHWADPVNHFGMRLSAGSADVHPDAKGRVNFSLSWYTKLVSVPLSSAEQRTAGADFQKITSGHFPDNIIVLELRATTSNAEEKRIYLIVPDEKPGLPEWLVGFECNGACFRDDDQPMMFVGHPNR